MIEETESPVPQNEPNPPGEQPEDGQPAPSDSPASKSAEGDQPTAAVDPDLETGGADERRGAQVINQFFAGVNADRATFGISGELSARASTGRIRQAEVEHALRVHVPPAPADNGQYPDRIAARILQERHLVAIVGDEGIGRRTGTLALLRERTTERRPLVSLSPAMSFAQLNENRFEPGNGYLVLDWLGEPHAGALQKFEVERLSDKLRTAGAYLVITAEPRSIDRRSLDGLVVDWSPPPSTELFEAWLAQTPHPPLSADDMDRLRARAVDLRLPRDVAALVGRLPQGVDRALEALEDSQRDKVAEWFKTTSDWQELLQVAALAFAYGLPQRRFEELHARLIEIDRAEDLRPTTVTESDAPPLQARLTLTKEDGLITRLAGSPLNGNRFGGERLVVFRSPAVREYVLAELHECGYALWKPLRSWIHELAAARAVDVRLQAALGVALLARTPTAAAEVEQTFLETWSAGLAAQRFTAAFALAWMAGDDTLAPGALRIALRWAKDSGQRPGVTAAVALGGPLGVRYPTEAIAWLWYLSTRAKSIRVVAARSLALLFCSMAGDLDNAARLLRRLLVRLRRTLDDRRHLHRDHAALDAVLQVLSVHHLEHEEPMVAYVLRECPSATPAVGALWAESLRSAPHRPAAIDALRATLEALSSDTGAVDQVRALGEAVREELTGQERELLQRSLSWAFRANDDDSDRYRPVIAALLAALAGSASHPRISQHRKER